MSDPVDTPNWRRLDGRITTSGQPSGAQLEGLHGLGVRTIINLGLQSHEKALPDEHAAVTALGMRYVHIPVDFSRPTAEDFTRFCDAMAVDRDHPVHVHCIANFRVSAFIYLYQRDVLNVPEVEARALMDSVWQPGGVWAGFIGDDSRAAMPHAGPIGS